MSFIASKAVYAQESSHPPHPITTLGIATKVLAKTLTNSHYKVIGSCTWAVGQLPPTLVVVPAIEQFLPDLIVTVANQPDDNPWVEANAVFENPVSRALYQETYRLATGSALGFGDDANQTTALHINDERTRVVNVIGSPNGFYRLPYLSHKAETKMGVPYYLSEADAVADRTELAEMAYMATHPSLLINHDIQGHGQLWGHEIPRLMRVTHPSRFRASVVAAMHAADIVTNKNSLHVTQSTQNSCGKNCVVAHVTFDPNGKHVIWQEVYPRNRTISVNESERLGINDDKRGHGNYVFVIWRQYRGCIHHKGQLIHALSFPNVGRPHKR